MRHLVCALFVGVGATAPLAQSGQIGISGGLTLSTPTQSVAGNSGWERTGWNLAIVFHPAPADASLSGTIVLSGASLSGAPYSGAPGGASGSGDYKIAGLSANGVWNVLASTSGPYVLAGAGWFAVNTTSTNGWNPNNPNLPGGGPPAGGIGAASYTVGTLGLNAGLGVRISSFFVEARATMLQRAMTPDGSGSTRLVTVPVTVGIWF